MDLRDTIELMESEDYKDRFKAEFYQLKIRYTKLINLLDKWDNNELDFEPSCPRGVYDEQVDAMAKYLDVLADRAEMEGIELEDF